MSTGFNSILMKIKRNDYSCYFSHAMGLPSIDYIQLIDNRYHVVVSCTRVGRGKSTVTIVYNANGDIIKEEFRR